MEQKKKCTHKDEFDNWTYEKQDDTCHTDRGTYGLIWFSCTQCDADISEEISYYLERED